MGSACGVHCKGFMDLINARREVRGHVHRFKHISALALAETCITLQLLQHAKHPTIPTAFNSSCCIQLHPTRHQPVVQPLLAPLTKR